MAQVEVGKQVNEVEGHEREAEDDAQPFLESFAWEKTEKSRLEEKKLRADGAGSPRLFDPFPASHGQNRRQQTRCCTQVGLDVPPSHFINKRDSQRRAFLFLPEVGKTQQLWSVS